MKILIHITATNDLLCHEALSMAFALASFEHEIQLYLGNYFTERLINEPSGKFANMLKSLDLYDIPCAWVDNLTLLSDKNIACFEQLCQKPEDLPTFETVFTL